MFGLTRSSQKLKQLNQMHPTDCTKKSIRLLMTIDNSNLKFKKIPIFVNQEGKISAMRLIDTLQLNYELDEGDSLTYWNINKQCYIFWCQLGDSFIPDLSQNLIVENQLKFKIRKIKKPFVEKLLEQQSHSLETGSAGRRQKKGSANDKKLGEIVRKVSVWRMLYLGFKTVDGEYVEEHLDTAASQVGTAKKTLDDYLLQIRTAREIGFDFNSNQDMTIGDLREFVKRHKKGKLDL